MKRLLPVSLALALTLLCGSADAWAKANASGAAMQPTPRAEATGSAKTVSAASSLEPSYAAREARAKGLETFEGGDVVVIGSSTLIIVLIVILILIII